MRNKTLWLIIVCGALLVLLVIGSHFMGIVFRPSVKSDGAIVVGSGELIFLNQYPLTGVEHLSTFRPRRDPLNSWSIERRFRTSFQHDFAGFRYGTFGAPKATVTVVVIPLLPFFMVYWGVVAYSYNRAKRRSSGFPVIKRTAGRERPSQ